MPVTIFKGVADISIIYIYLIIDYCSKILLSEGIIGVTTFCLHTKRKLNKKKQT